MIPSAFQKLSEMNVGDKIIVNGKVKEVIEIYDELKYVITDDGQAVAATTQLRTVISKD